MSTATQSHMGRQPWSSHGRLLGSGGEERGKKEEDEEGEPDMAMPLPLR